MESSDLQERKALRPIDLIVVGRETDDNDEHPEKVLPSMMATLGGIVMAVSDEQPLNAQFPIQESPSGKVTCTNLVQP